jgi:lipoate-protein ligase A
LGYAQPYQDVDVASLVRQGWEVVRRPTGGRAILHTDELTYAVIGPHSEPRLAGGVLESYQRISAALLQALQRLGLPVQAQPLPGAEAASAAKGPVCFEVPSNYEITAGGKKLVGSAQARRREGVLQHGTFPLYGDLRRIIAALSFPSDERRQQAARRVLERATTAETCLGYALDWQTAAQAFQAAFREVLTLELAPGELSAMEIQRARELETEKYRSPAWTERV